MSLFGERIQPIPLLIPQQGTPVALERVSVTDKLFQESWLQKLIFENPSLLPVSEIEPVFGPLVAIGREVSTNVGFIDNLFISPQGYLTIVETKLWRNPEARREVVGQIIDYAKELSLWSFDRLDQTVRAFFKNKKFGVIEALRSIEDIAEEDESDIIDSITRNLQRGRLLLLIVGDGIRESTEAMAEFLSQTPQLHFCLALIELQVFKIGEDMLVIPQIVTRTREITRAVIRLEGGTVQNISVDLDVSREEKGSGAKRYTLSEEEFFESMRRAVGDNEILFAKELMKSAQEMGCEIEMRQASYVIKLSDPMGSGQRLTLLVINKNGEFYIGWLLDQLERAGLKREVGVAYYEAMKALFQGCETNPKKDTVWAINKAIDKLDELKQLIEDTIREINASAETIES